MPEDLKRLISDAHGSFQQKLRSAPPDAKILTTQTQIAHDLIAIRAMLQHLIETTPMPNGRV
jgi:hypothetical protein